MNTSFEAILNAIKDAKGFVVDDHRSNGGNIRLAGVGELVKGESHIVVALCDSKYFSLNRMYVGDDRLAHVSREAVAGVVRKFDLTVEEAVEKYNEAQEGAPFSCGKIEKIQMFNYV